MIFVSCISFGGMLRKHLLLFIPGTKASLWIHGEMFFPCKSRSLGIRDFIKNTYVSRNKKPWNVKLFQVKYFFNFYLFFFNSDPCCLPLPPTWPPQVFFRRPTKFLIFCCFKKLKMLSLAYLSSEILFGSLEFV